MKLNLFPIHENWYERKYMKQQYVDQMDKHDFFK